MEKMLSRLAICAIVIAIFSVPAAAQQQFMPHQFKGTVTVNGAPAPDGIPVTAVSGDNEAGTTTVNGNYGRSGSDLLFVEDPDGDMYGKTVEFFVGGIKAAEYVFSNGESTVLDLSVSGDLGICGDNICSGSESCSSCPSDCGECQNTVDDNNGGNDNTRTSSTTTYDTPCTEDWSCSEWSICSQEGMQLRSCTDANNCGTTDSKPIVEKSCTYTREEAPKICQAGITVCTGDDLMRCPDGTYWEKVRTCENGCDPEALACRTASGDIEQPGPFDFLAGLFGGSVTGLSVGSAGMAVAGAVIAVVLIVLIALFLRKR